MNNKKGFNLFGKKNKELPNQSNNLENNNIEQNNMLQPPLLSETPLENQTSVFEQNTFTNSSPIQEPSNTNFETNILNNTSTPELVDSNTLERTEQQLNNSFIDMPQSEFSNQETEQSIETQLASTTSIQLQTPQSELTVAQPPVEETSTQIQETPVQPQPEPGTINVLNNLGTYSMDLKETAKKEINKKPFIIIAGLLAFLLCLTGLVTGGSSKIFGKAPNDIVVPGENEEEPSHKVETPEEGEEIIENDEYHENSSNQEENVGNSNNEEQRAESTPQTNQSIRIDTLKEGTIEDTVEKYEYTQLKEGAVFDTSVTNPSPVVLASNTNTIHEIKQEGQIFTISRDGIVVFYLDMAINQENFTEGYYPYARGNDLNNYLLIKIKRSNGFGDFYILDENFQIIEQGNYEEQYTPVATKEGIYFGIINCNGKRSSKKNGPTIDVYKFDTINGSKTYRYSIDYNNEMNKCS